MLSVLTSWFMAFLLGLRHATEPDHVAAVATLVPEQRNVSRGLQLGAAWGLGHSLAIFACGGALLLLRRQLPERVSDWLELGVAGMLLLLGCRSLLRAVQTRQHAHDGPAHVHARRKSLFIGLLHGVAGSGSLAALVFANMTSVRAGLGFLLCFAIGSLLGMAALAGFAAAPLRWLTRKADAHALLFASAGLLSLAIGAHYGWSIAQRLFT